MNMNIMMFKQITNDVCKKKMFKKTFLKTNNYIFNNFICKIVNYSIIFLSFIFFFKHTYIIII